MMNVGKKGKLQLLCSTFCSNFSACHRSACTSAIIIKSLQLITVEVTVVTAAIVCTCQNEVSLKFITSALFCRTKSVETRRRIRERNAGCFQIWTTSYTIQYLIVGVLRLH